MIVENNTFTHNEIGVEFTRIEPFADMPPFTADGSRAVGNVLTKNAGNGNPRPTYPASRSAATPRRRTADRNGCFPGAVDLGGNIAFGNTLGQCVGVIRAGK